MIPKQDLPSVLRQELSLALSESLSNLSISTDAQEKLVDYLLILQEWNAVHNLTGIEDPIQMLKLHVLDSIVLTSSLNGQRIIDIGTGAGVPGIPLAIVRPDLKFVLLDSNQKKINFVQHVILSLGLRNVEAICQRVERYSPAELFDCAISRAFASLKDFVVKAMPLVKPEGILMAMKGQIEQAKAEVKDLQKESSIKISLLEIRSLTVPTLKAERSVVLIKKK